MSPPPPSPTQCGSRSRKSRRLADRMAGAGGDLIDYVRFRAVCTHWNSSTVSPHGRGLIDPRFHPRRWMLFPEGHGPYPGHPNLGGYVRFFNLSTGAFVRVHLPLFDDHVVLDSTDGLLVVLRHPDTAVRVLHPFTGDIADLPPVFPLLPQINPHICRRYMTEDMKLRELDVAFLKGVCAAVSVDAAGAITVMLGLDTKRRVAYATAGCERWFLSPWTLPRLRALHVSFEGKLYVSAVNSADENNIYICQIDPPRVSDEGYQSLPEPRMLVKCPLDGPLGTAHLVQCGSELMLAGFNDTWLAHLAVYRVSDLIKGRVVPMKDIGDHAIFFEPAHVSTNTT
ncbi:hypothetical protein HU200_026058 [Digitaria exilis]|uniref:KIB1-4 beta-propeller domain-containing protein n=1 Tax=Digitaria exilis TaxID=1010633 RepID=A0A835C421_9POAL|nr:hypothetical protein HU200_026058 [Digitaria exilis]